MIPFLQLIPEYRDYVWGGQRLRPGPHITAEAWVVHEANRIRGGELAGHTLAEAAEQLGAALLGSAAYAQSGTHFPLLIKLLDANQWLSVQVHPNDEQAVQLEGPGHFGKTEAWHILEAEPGAQLIAGLRPGVGRTRLQQAMGKREMIDYLQYYPVQAGDTVYMPAGTLHALGPGLLLYEVQQTSNLTYRVYDWDRPATKERRLHLEQSLAVIDPETPPGGACPIPAPVLEAGGKETLVRCPYFTLNLLAGHTIPIEMDTRRISFHALTVIEGHARVQSAGQQVELERFETLIVPADCGAYQVLPLQECRLLEAEVGVGE